VRGKEKGKLMEESKVLRIQARKAQVKMFCEIDNHTRSANNEEDGMR